MAGIELGPPAQQVSGLSITPLPLGISKYPNLAEKMFKSSVHVITNRNVIIGNIGEIVFVLWQKCFASVTKLLMVNIVIVQKTSAA